MRTDYIKHACIILDIVWLYLLLSLYITPDFHDLRALIIPTKYHYYPVVGLGWKCPQNYLNGPPYRKNVFAIYAQSCPIFFLCAMLHHTKNVFITYNHGGLQINARELAVNCEWSLELAVNCELTSKLAVNCDPGGGGVFLPPVNWMNE